MRHTPATRQRHKGKQLSFNRLDSARHGAKIKKTHKAPHMKIAENGNIRSPQFFSIYNIILTFTPARYRPGSPVIAVFAFRNEIKDPLVPEPQNFFVTPHCTYLHFLSANSRTYGAVSAVICFIAAGVPLNTCFSKRNRPPETPA